MLTNMLYHVGKPTYFHLMASSMIRNSEKVGLLAGRKAKAFLSMGLYT